MGADQHPVNQDRPQIRRFGVHEREPAELSASVVQAGNRDSGLPVWFVALMLVWNLALTTLVLVYIVSGIG